MSVTALRRADIAVSAGLAVVSYLFLLDTNEALLWPYLVYIPLQTLVFMILIGSSLGRALQDPEPASFVVMAAARCAIFVLWIVGIFASLYFRLSQHDSSAFEPDQLGQVEAIYFSVVTFATVGYGDIHPASTGAKLAVIVQILISIVTLVVLLGLMVNAVARASEKA